MGGIGYFWTNAMRRLLWLGERRVRGMLASRRALPTSPSAADALWDPLTQPLPGIADTLASGLYPVIPNPRLPFTLRQSIAAQCHWLLTQTLPILAPTLFTWSDATPTERKRMGAIVCVGALYSAELATVAGMPVPPQPLAGWVPGVGIPELYTPPDHPVWRPAWAH